MARGRTFVKVIEFEIPFCDSSREAIKFCDCLHICDTWDLWNSDVLNTCRHTFTSCITGSIYRHWSLLCMDLDCPDCGSTSGFADSESEQNKLSSYICTQHLLP